MTSVLASIKAVQWEFKINVWEAIIFHFWELCQHFLGLYLRAKAIHVRSIRMTFSSYCSALCYKLAQTVRDSQA